MKVYAFDFDETFETSNGPVTLEMLRNLRNEGHIVGICGNWAGFVHTVSGWQNVVSFINCGGTPKEVHLNELKRWIPADDFVMVGNVFGEKNSLGFVGGSHDSEVAANCGWRFIKEDDFANGAR